ncbi:iron-siderophore ABC transporter substrate-binding protein [Umezakia ovalisporum]|jgi:iron complex transport system substrate-binding protein|uniref:iron-siderophore ABC transporter substrate-binding protein n=2 Tax=Umezakia ovalisporum TaxID=75695 RepID=UPI0024748011|nr:iron-siderophore ABC transporter substrate-binding protein [Umezakia ovalisporum]MBI1241614.1 ABC transporter substrate-binding protein [Nostoc sp. RI_552]MDH6086257.1 iron-siderophore ABC transporter substrate-binding protein [Umezakia ovalisporum TAC611]MDH6089678.1 iron-siderophore ABC transporter substrate-binding protein [Umezakia ovalisporum Ak1311]
MPIRKFFFGNFISLLLTIATGLIIISCGINNTRNFHLNSVDIDPVRVVRHAMGQTKVPFHPQRIVVLGGLDNILALGIKPIAATTLSDNNFVQYLDDLTDGIEKIGMNGQPNLEKILYLKPDLILGLDWDANLYEELSLIAPTVLAQGDIDWKRWLTKFGEALGKTEKAEKLLQDYDQRIKNLRQQLGDNLPQTQVSLVNFWKSYARIYMNRSFGGLILQEIGLPRPIYQNQNKTQENISLELIPKIEGDAVFLILGGHNESKLQQFINHPLWLRLPAVQENRVYPVTSDIWIASWGIIGANGVVDDIFKYLVGKNLPSS